MLNKPRSCIATKALLLVALLCAGSLASAAQVAGIIAHLSGPLLAKKADGTVKILAQKSEFEQGDTLVSEKNTYAQLKFIDNSEMTLKPGTTFTIEKFAFDAGRPEADSAAFNLVKGGLRAVTGLLGKRNKERFSLKTPSATIGIRGTTFIVQYMAPEPELLAPKAPQAGLAPGLYVHVIDGMINVSNEGAAQNFHAGQFGFVPAFNKPPVLVPPNPVLEFAPPPAFSSPVANGAPGSIGNQDKAAIDCVVR